MSAKGTGRAARPVPILPVAYGVPVFPLKDDNPTYRTAWVTIGLIIVNVLVFVGPQRMADPQNTERDVLLEFAAIPCEVVTGDGLTALEIEALYQFGDVDACDADPIGPPRFPDKPARLAILFSMFMHGSWLHLLGNMWFLWLFGNNIEDRLGRLRYLAFYLGGGIAASLAHVAVQPDSIVPVVGASGAVAATMGAYLVWFPNAPIRTVVVIVLWRIRAKWWLVFWFVTQFFVDADSPVAWMAHVGGFVYGALVAMVVRRSPAARRRAFRPEYRFDGTERRWDSTGGAGSSRTARSRRR